jgi:hypothetical protein
MDIALPLYAQEIKPSAWQRCGGNTDDDGDRETCVEFADLPSGAIAVRDTKNRDAGELRFDAAERREFVARMAAIL